MALREIPKPLRRKTRVIYQSAESVFEQADPAPTASLTFASSAICAREKDPLRAAMAVRDLPSKSRIQRHPYRSRSGSAAGKNRKARNQTQPALSLDRSAFAWKNSPTLGAAADLVCITSKMEGSSNVLSEALASRVPVVASRISGLMGTLGNRFPGYFPVGDTERLKALLLKAESQPKFYRDLTRYCARLSDRVKPKREIEAWRRLLAQFA